MNRLIRSGATSDLPSATVPAAIPLRKYVSLRQVPWSLAYIGFLTYFIVITTYIAAVGTIAMGAAILGLFLSKLRFRWPLAATLLLLFLVWASIANTMSDYPGGNELLVVLGKIVLVFLVGVNVLWHPLALRFFILLFVTCFALFPVRGTLFNYYIYLNADFGRPSWRELFGNPNDMAALTILTLALVAGFFHKETPRIIRAFALVLAPILLFVVLLTQSRAAFLGTSVFIFLVMISIRKHRFRAYALVVVGLSIVVQFAPPDVWQRIVGLQYALNTETVEKVDPEGSAAQRWHIWQTGFRIISDHPITGVGVGRYEAANQVYAPELGGKDIHNTFLEILAETGVPGLMLFVWMLVVVLRRARRARKNAIALRLSADWRRLQLLEFGMYGYLVAGIWGTYAFLSLLYIYLAVLIVQSEILAEQANNM